MKLKLLFSCFILFFLCALSSFSQTTLSAGDIAITGFTTDNPDQFTFVLLVDVESGTQVNFTDRGWDSVAGAFRSGEGTLIWTATSNLSAGTNIYVQDLDNPFTADVGTITDDGSFQLSGSGDQILVYQGTDLSPTFLNAIHTDGDDGGWSNATGTSSTALPPGLTDGVDAIYFGEIDNGSFMCTGNPINGSPSYVLSEIVDVSNWELDNSSLSTTPLGGGCTYSIMDPCTDISGTDSDGDGINDACDEDEDNDGIPDYLDGCSTIDIANTIAIGIPITDGSSYSLEETTITYNTTNPNTNYGYVAGNQGNAIRFQGSTLNEELELGFSVPIQNVNFKLTDFDQGEQVTVNAYDDLNNLINLTSNNVPLKGSLVDRTGNFFENNDSAPESDGDDEADDIKGGVHFYFSGAISRIVFIYNTGGGQSIRFTELNYCLKDSDGDSILDFRDIDSDNDGIADLVEAGGVDLDGDGYIENPADNNGNGIPDIYDFRCTNSPSANGWATSVHNSVNTSNANDALGNGTFSYADIGVGGSLELQFSDIIPAGNNVIIRHVRQSGSGQLPFMVERSSDGITYSNDESFLTSFNGSYEVLSYVLIGGNTSYVKITNLSSETLGIDYAKYSYGLNANCSGINGVLITNLDNDNDGIANSRDLDSDNDGIFDVIEANLPDTDNNGLADNFADLDSDGFNDNYDGDVGNDGVAENMTSAAIITGNDTDADGIPNTYPNVNQDSNGYPNPFDIDADDDGIPDNIEAQPTLGYIVPAGAFNFNGLDTAYLSGIYPEDTDVDGIPDYLDSDSDSDGIPDIQENGDVNAISNIDIDSDGLDDAFDGNTTTFDVNDEISSGNPANMTAAFGDADGDLLTGGDLDYRDLFDINTPAVAALDFDGVDDYFEISTSQINSLDEFTLSFWVKPNSLPTGSVNDERFIIGQKQMFEIVLGPGGNNIPKIWTKHHYGGGLSANGTGIEIGDTDWLNYTVSVDYINERIKIYVNGAFITNMGMNGPRITNAFPFRIGSKKDSQPGIGENFEGWIDEVRIFDTLLTRDQIQQLVYQEIENNGGVVRGSEIPKDIKDNDTDATIPWSSLIAYYPMTNIKSGKITDQSGNGFTATLHNMNSLQPQTAPMPFETVADGPWTTEGTWLHGDVWDIEDFEAFFTQAYQKSPEPYSIVKIHHNVTTTKSHEALGMFIDSGITLTVNGDNSIMNNWYLQLDGTLDLADDSQLVQTENSDLVTSAAGKILRRQEGNNNHFWYNYWTSPVGATGITTLSDNNGPTNNTNNSAFNLDMLKDGLGTDLEFTSAFDEAGKISRSWLYNFQNGITYYDWVNIDETTPIAPGVGYTQKGTGNAGTEQQYLFEGKPNNGTILVTADDVTDIYEAANGGESVQDTTLVTSLVGNPYPSALDAEEFIRDNIDFDNGGANPTIKGTILLWEQWAGDTHWLSEYEGGYGFINLTSTERAYQHPDIVIADPENPDNRGIKTPTKFLPVGQGFFVEVVTDLGEIEFNNSQRTFKRESTGESVFLRDATETTVEEENTLNETQILRLEFGVSSGASRSFVLGFSEQTTDGFDYGYDGGLITNPPADDMGSLLNGQQYVIQAFAPITPDKEVDLVLHASGNYTYSLKSTEITNIPESQPLFIRDNLTGNTYDLRSAQQYDFTSVAGSFTDRFQVIFEDPTLSTPDEQLNNVLVFMDNDKDLLFVKGLQETAKGITISNMLGQISRQFSSVSINTLKNGIDIGELSSGIYIVNIATESNGQISKKIIKK